MRGFPDNIWAPLLIAVLLIKVTSFHVYQHQDSAEDESSHCELCVISVNSQNAEGTFQPSLEIDRPVSTIPAFAAILSPSACLFNSPEEQVHFSRPPPALLF